jgi:hypothetical protein
VVATGPSRVLAGGLFLIVCLRSLVRYSSGVRRIGRTSENLVLVMRQPFLNHSRVFVEGGEIDARIADDQKDLLLRVRDETRHEVDEDRTIQGAL